MINSEKIQMKCLKFQGSGAEIKMYTDEGESVNPIKQDVFICPSSQYGKFR